MVRGMNRGAEQEKAGGGVVNERVTPVDRLAVTHLTQPVIVGRCPIAAEPMWSNTLPWWMRCSAQISKWLHDRLVCYMAS